MSKAVWFAGVAAAMVMVGSAQAQSMNIPEIVETTLNEVCGPWMQTGDRGGAVLLFDEMWHACEYRMKHP